MESKIHPIRYSFFEIKKIIRDLTAKYPFLNTQVIGKSAAGRDIFALSLGSAKEEVLFLAGDDPSYPITTLILLKFCENVLNSILKGKELCGLDMRKALFGRRLTFIPLLNPDGAEIRLRGETEFRYVSDSLIKLAQKEYKIWKSNLRGVEISRNFKTGFEKRREQEKLQGIHSPKSGGFSGYIFESEAETIALAEFCRKRSINHFIHISAFGETVSYYNGETNKKEGGKMAEIVSAVSQYSICPPFGDADSNICNWFSSEFSAPSLCLKIGKTGDDSVNRLYEEYERLKEALTLSSLF